MSIIRKVKAVERVFGRLGEELESFKQKTKIHCLEGCGRCCNKPDILATPLEFLPLAFHWFTTREASEKLSQLETDTSPICNIYKPLSSEIINLGSCGLYQYRGLICRLFGFSSSRDKHEFHRLVTCRPIKENQPEDFQKAEELVKDHQIAPVIADYYKKMVQIDFKLASQFLPINEAIKQAVREVLHYYSYRPFPKPRKVA